MTAIKITVDDNVTTLNYEAKTAENIGKRIEQLKAGLNTDNYGVCVVLGLNPTESNVRLLRRYQRDPEQASYREMPENQWKILLMLCDGQPSCDL
ncbi:hypothetical protein [Pseudoalteromonas peptidolytica]|uniref:Uncharacterized protein n=1 Tax=Pseudoalteromonas peptidolytica F12-50-A1 TaxID=1315280 RepID=A0A8I0T594_9GAMM|nr:hypothetical protein [Pseudoalteromonas peptidolytica]MBE0348241.1 hypothetical protein [Pseudoalteromonas peptidolytica F12-50-A1]NLR16530.1 hypothetical protein [Pseudoalteromonas peptidolytica]GEK11920.1 hypothetical protein PPE03_41690 [Pseudoalteromonas peptidolytica]